MPGIFTCASVTKKWPLLYHHELPLLQGFEMSSTNLEHTFQEVLITIPTALIWHIIMHIFSSLQHAQTNV